MIYSLPYLLFFICICVFSFFKGPKNTNVIGISANKSIFFEIFLLSIVFIGFRSFISTDACSYYPWFQKVPTLTHGGLKYCFTSQWEFGFSLYTVIFKSIIPDWFFYQFSLCLIDYVILYYFFREYFEDIYTILTAFCFFFVFQGFGIERNLLRNSKSILLFLLSIKYIHKHKFIKYCFVNLIGFLFHSSALLYIPFYFIANLRVKKKYLIFLFLIGNIFFIGKISISGTILLPFGEMGLGRLSEYILIYVKYGYKSYGFSIGYLERTLSTLLVLYFYYKIINEKKYIPIVNMFFLYQFLYLFFSDLAMIPQRVALLFIPSYWILYPKIYEKLRKDWKYLFIVCFLVYGLIRIYKESNIPIFYYQNYLFNYPSMRSFDEYQNLVRTYILEANK